MTTSSVVVAGLGDSGLLTAINLARRGSTHVVGIGTKPGTVLQPWGVDRGIYHGIRRPTQHQTPNPPTKE